MRITSDFFCVPRPLEDEPLTCRMRLEYNKEDGIRILINKRGDDAWLLHSTPFPAAVPRADLKKFVALFYRSVRKFNPKATFEETSLRT